MAIKALIFSRFDGGWSADPRVGIKNSQAYTHGFDFRSGPSQLSVSNALVRNDTPGTIRDLITDLVKPPGLSSTWAIGDTGYVYRYGSGAWGVFSQLNASAGGVDFRADTDSLYLTGTKTVSAIKTMSATPTLLSDTYGISFSTYNNSSNAGFNVNAYQVGSTLTTAIAVATNPLNETSTNVRYLQSDIEPLNKVSLFIPTKGTGNWTVTLHDGLNNVLGTTTVANANLTNGTFNDFVFSAATNAQVRLYVAPNARTYHTHVTSTVADGTVSSTATNNLGTCDLQVWADRMVYSTQHPIKRFLQYELIGNGNYLSAWEPLTEPPTNSEWRRHALVFPQPYNVSSIAVQNEFAVIATDNGYDSILFFWDGLSPTYNFFIQVPEGPIYALNSYKNMLYYNAGNSWWSVTSSASQPVKLKSLPGFGTTGTVATNGSSVSNGITLLGYMPPQGGTPSPYKAAVYSWGAVDKNFPNSFGLEYAPSPYASLASDSGNLRMGMVKSYGPSLYTSWRDAGTSPVSYGIDLLSTTIFTPLSIWQSLVFDNNYAAKFKTALYMEAYFLLPVGATLTMAYSIDGGAFVSDSSSYTSTNLWQGQPNYARFNIATDNGGRFHEIQLQITVTTATTTTTAPTVSMTSLVFDDGKSELLA